MAQTNNRFFDEAARLMNDAAGVAQGVRREFDTMLRHQAERILGDLDVVRREEFEAVKEMARLAREERRGSKRWKASFRANPPKRSLRMRRPKRAARSPIWATVKPVGPAGSGRSGKFDRFSCLCRVAPL